MAKLFVASNGTLPSGVLSADGSMIVAIKAALVTGYDGNQSAGWRLVYESIANAADTTNRIVVQSQSVSSEQRYFEIIDDGANSKINCYEDWTLDAGVGLLISAIINKTGPYGGFNIVASDKFVHLVMGAVYHAFGDIDVIESAVSQTVLLQMKAGSAQSSYYIASTNKKTRNEFVTENGAKLYCRSLAAETQGFGPMIDDNTYMGGDKVSGSDSASGRSSTLHKIELMKDLGSGEFGQYGFLPDAIYTDNPQTMADSTLVINNQLKSLKKITCIGSWHLLMAVDV